MIKPVLAVTEPIAFPTLIPTCPMAPAISPASARCLPSMAPITDTNNSGKVVARETIVAPMINLGIPLFSAIQLLASTKKSPPFTINIIHKAKSKVK